MSETILITAHDAALLLCTTRRRILRLARDKQIPFVDLGDDEPRFVASELREWAASMMRREGQVEHA
jgi:hypothetical protein